MRTEATFAEPERSTLIPLTLWALLALVVTLWIRDTGHHTDCSQYPDTEGTVLVNYADLPPEAASCLLKD